MCLCGLFLCLTVFTLNYFFLKNNALLYSKFILAILSTEIPCGHSTSQASVFEQCPNNSVSIRVTISTTRLLLSSLP